MSGLQRLYWQRFSSRPRYVASAASVAVAIGAAETILIITFAVAGGVAYHMAAYGSAGAIGSYFKVGCLAALLYILPWSARGDYALQQIQAGGIDHFRVIRRWTACMLFLGVVGFLTKTTGVFSRMWVVLFYLIGMAGLLTLHRMLPRIVRNLVHQGTIVRRRLHLIGTDAQIARYWQRRKPSSGEQFVEVSRLPTQVVAEPDSFQRLLGRALADISQRVRSGNADAVLLLTPAAEADTIRQVVDTLAQFPVTVHLDGGAVMDRVTQPRLERLGGLNALTLVSDPISPAGAMCKRIVDITLSLLAMIVLALPLLLVAIAIKLDSRGPVLFRQRRRGFNQEEFRIVKLRTMTSLDDGDMVVQARVGDRRITRVGAVLRRYNIDELPQLWNVLKGEMSLVGPRPHAVAHDQIYEKRIALYARRLNVKPGITGWAQVNGFRGETSSDEQMRGRLEHDLHYIDNWSMRFDFWIMLLTIFSRRAFANAR